MSGADLNEMKTQFEDYRNTDVELLKKCINMTNENSELKRQLKSFQTEISRLKSQNVFLQKQLQNSRFQLSQTRGKQSTKNTKNDSPYNKLNQNNDFSLMNNEQLHQKSLSSHNMPSFKSNLIEQQSKRFNEQIRRIQQRHRREIGELQQRLRVSNQKREQLEQVVVRQRQKCRRLFRFINQEIPEMKDVVTRLTNKVETQVEALLLRDINQNYEHQINPKKNPKPY